jgi:hypothetical protein
MTVGAGVVWSWVGAFMAARFRSMVCGGPAESQASTGPHCPPDSIHKGLHTIPQMASPTHPNPPRPYGILG